MKLAKTILAAASALALAAGSAHAASHAKPVKVGMITTLSGGGAGLGIDVRDGFMLALEQAGADNVEVVVRDDTRKPDVAVQIADEMIQSEKVDILTGIIWSNLLLAVAPGAVRQDVFYLSPNAGASALSGKGCHENYFNVSWQNDTLPEAGGMYANETGYKNTFLMAPNYPAGKDMVNGYMRTFEGTKAAEVYTKLGQSDYAAEIAQIRASDADSVFFFLPGGMGIAFMKQYAASGVDKPLIGPAFSFDQGILQAVGEAAMGIRNTSQWNKDLDNAANAKFVAGFQEKYGRLPSLYASQGYDTANLILSAMGKAHPSDTDAFREALRAADFDAVRGDFKFGVNHHPIQDIYVREVVKEGDIFTNKTVAKVADDHLDSYAADCKM
ncbi:MAG: ABC transporter substrate-binding protein [Pseudomonadota bacterium]